MRQKEFTPLRQRLRRIKVVSPLRLCSGVSPAFTAVELLITLFIAAAFLMSGYQLYNLIIKDGGETRMQARASNVAYDYLQRYKSNVTNPCTVQTPLTDSPITVDNLTDVTVSIAITCPYASTTPAATECTGGTITHDGLYTVHKFTTVGASTLTCTNAFTSNVLVVAGGGGGAACPTAGYMSGGGGAGGLVYNPTFVIPATTSPVTIGGGGAGGLYTGGLSGGAVGVSGGNSVFGTITAYGGGGGGKGLTGATDAGANGIAGGSGGGGGGTASGATPTGGDADYISPRQGYDGGNGTSDSSGFSSGGGGSSAVGEVGHDYGNSLGGAGTDHSSVFGTGIGVSGVLAKGGDGQAAIYADGTANTGNGGTGGKNGVGGGGGAYGYNNGAIGGSGIVIVRYLTPTTIPTSPTISKVLVTIKYGDPQLTISNGVYATTAGTATPITAISAITGTTAVGSVLTAGALTPSGATASYQWQSSTTAGGIYTNISSATASTYTLVAGDAGKYLKVVATGTGDYTGIQTSAATTVVTDGYTKLLLHFDGSDGSIVFTDSSPVPKSVTAVGSAQIDTAQSKFGGSSALFDGTGDYLTIPSSDDFAMGTGDFTVDFWMRASAIRTSDPGWNYLMSTSNLGFMLTMATRGQTGSEGFQLWLGAGTPYGSVPYIFVINTWYHIAVTRNGTNLRFFLNGTQLGPTMTSSDNITVTAEPLEIARRVGWDSTALPGWLDEFRISKGIARWITDFTPPTQAY